MIVSRRRDPSEERAKRSRLNTIAPVHSIEDMVDRVAGKTAGLQAETARHPSAREEQPGHAHPLDYSILEPIAELAEACADFLEAVQAGRFEPTDLLPIPPARQSFRVMLGPHASEHRFRNGEEAERYARVWCGKAGRHGLNVRILEQVTTVVAHYRLNGSSGDIQVFDEPTDWLREAAEIILGKAL